MLNVQALRIVKCDEQSIGLLRVVPVSLKLSNAGALFGNMAFALCYESLCFSKMPKCHLHIHAAKHNTAHVQPARAAKGRFSN